MHFAKFITAAACCFTLGLASQPSDANLIDKATFQKDIAPSLIQRISNFRSENADTLQPDQNAYLDKILEKIEKADRSDLDSVALEATELFGKETARTLLAGRRDLLGKPQNKRAPTCSCATDSDWCANDTTCSNYSCGIQPNECGTFGAYDCDGMCA